MPIFMRPSTFKNFILFLNAKFDVKIKSITNLTNNDFYTDSGVKKNKSHSIKVKPK